jgi:type I restriction enzyme S subunit
MAATLRDLVPSGPSIGLIADLAKSQSEKYILAQGAYGFKIDLNRVKPSYLVWLSNYEPFREYIKRYCVGSTQIHIRTPVFQELKIPLPPLSYQWKIAEVLDRAEELRSKRREAIAQLDALTPAIFLEMFGDPVTNPKGWERKPIKKIGEVITGNTPSRTNPDYYGTAIEWIKSDNINTPYYYLTQAEEGLSEAGKAVARIVAAGAILVTCIAGSPACIGNAAIVNREVAFNQQINALVPQQGNVHFLFAQILTAKRLIQDASTASMKGMVSKSRFEEIRLIFPPLNLQQEFAKRIEAVEKLKAAHRASLSELDALFASLQHRAFRGEL